MEKGIARRRKRKRKRNRRRRIFKSPGIGLEKLSEALS